MKKRNTRNVKTNKNSLRQDIMFALLLLMCVPFIVFGYVIYRVDLPTYKHIIEGKISDKIGRSIKIKGDISWSASIDNGVSLAVKNISIGNPSWASRDLMAQIGMAKLHVELLPLLKKKLNITAFGLGNVELQLETDKKGRTNWTFNKIKNTQKNQSITNNNKTSPSSFVEINIKKVTIKNSEIGFLNKNGKLKTFKIPKLILNVKAQTTHLKYKGSFSGINIEMDLVGGAFKKINSAKWPFNTQIIFDKIRFDAKGYLKNNVKKVIFRKYLLSSKKSKIKGSMIINLNSSKPAIKAFAKSKYINPSDFAISFKEQKSNKPKIIDHIKEQEIIDNKKGRIFSNEKIDFNSLKSVDLTIDIIFDKLKIGMTSISDFMSKLYLKNGVLSLSSTKGKIAKSMAIAALKLDTSVRSPKLSFAIKANNIDLSSFVELGGIESIIEGKSDVDVLINTKGRSLHDFASFANGHVNVLMNTGTISKSTLRSIAGSLVDLFAPGMSMLMDTGVNCMAARYTIEQGLLKTKGLLIDTPATTIMGTGYANLADERINMSLITKPKVLSLGSMIPSMNIRGSLVNPNFMLDTDNTIDKVTELISGKQIDNGVPNIVEIKGKNSCAFTLDNPIIAKLQKQKKQVLVPGSSSNNSPIGSTINNVLKNLSKGFFNK